MLTEEVLTGSFSTQEGKYASCFSDEVSFVGTTLLRCQVGPNKQFLAILLANLVGALRDDRRDANREVFDSGG